eukprot:TRINITY_DN66667_c4_g1_i1.p1 TRINITY_DN66667_c4_g1~~TRINITY_DN66667_c4_g1_i1.p1  ORF type:complete len:909 (-),score=474.29 TRINITY_DN66667_c4_g1_i1:1259-3985(-)
MASCSTTVLPLLALLLLVAHQAAAYSTGAGTCNAVASSVDNMVASGCANPDTATCRGGFWVSFDKTSWRAGETVQVTLNHNTGGTTFKGILIYATDSGGNRVGQWTVPTGFQHKSCGGESGSTLTHSSSAAKALRSFTWTPPAKGKGDVTFNTVVVKSSKPDWFILEDKVLKEALVGPSPDKFEWKKVEYANAAPSARALHAMVYDKPRHRLVMFGGQPRDNVGQETWQFDLATKQWTQIATGAVTKPDKRYDMAWSVDNKRERFYCVTGTAETAGTNNNEVWVFDLKANTWSKYTVGGDTLSSRHSSAGSIAHQNGTRMYIFAGFRASGGRSQDVLALDLAANTWKDLTPAGTKPVQRCLHAAASLDDHTFLTGGGCASGFGPCPLGDIWMFKANENFTAGTWTELRAHNTGTGPKASRYPRMVGLNKEIAIWWGGNMADDGKDIWVINATSKSVSKGALLNDSAPVPSPRQQHTLVFVDSGKNATDKYVLMFGGDSESANQNDMWRLNLPTSLYDQSQPAELAPGGDDDGGNGGGNGGGGSATPEADAQSKDLANAHTFSSTKVGGGKLDFYWTLDRTKKELTMAVRAKTSGYVAFGFSPDNRMVGTQAVLGWVAAGNTDDDGTTGVTTFEYKLSGRVVSGVTKTTTDNLSNKRGSQRTLDGTTYTLVKWTRPWKTSDFTIDVDNKINFAWSIGPGDKLEQHDSRGLGTVNLSTGEVTETGEDDLRTIHGVFMGLAWGFFLPLGILAARYFKHHDPTWFQVHRTFQSLGILFTIIGYIIAFVMVKGDHFSDFAGGHAYLGFAIVLFAVLQGTNGALRAHKGAPRRAAWELLHKNLGRLLMVASILQILGGMSLHDVSDGGRIVYIAWIIVLIVFTIISEVQLRGKRSTKLQSSSSMELNTLEGGKR